MLFLNQEKYHMCIVQSFIPLRNTETKTLVPYFYRKRTVKHCKKWSNGGPQPKACRAWNPNWWCPSFPRSERQWRKAHTV